LVPLARWLDGLQNGLCDLRNNYQRGLASVRHPEKTTKRNINSHEQEDRPLKKSNYYAFKIGMDETH